MNDMFDRRIQIGDIVVYASRWSSDTILTVARVIRINDETVRVKTIAGNQSIWKEGRGKFTDEGYVHVEYDGHEATLRASNNVMIANGIDAYGIHDGLIAKQALNRK